MTLNHNSPMGCISMFVLLYADDAVLFLYKICFQDIIQHGWFISIFLRLKENIWQVYKGLQNTVWLFLHEAKFIGTFQKAKYYILHLTNMYSANRWIPSILKSSSCSCIVVTFPFKETQVLCWSRSVFSSNIPVG